MDLSNINEVFAGFKIHLHTIIYLLAGTSALGLLVKFALDYIWKHYFASLTIPSSDSRYNWVILWLNNHGPLNDCQHISVALREPRNHGSWRSFSDDAQENSAREMKYDLLPRTCSYYFRHYLSGKMMHLQFQRAKDNGNYFTSSSYSTYYNECDTVTISTMGRSRALLESIIFDAETEFKKLHIGKTLVYHYSKDFEKGTWLLLNNPIMNRPWESVVTQNDIKGMILSDIKEFQNSYDHYLQRGIPYRRGYLLHGPPGTGKSSLIYSLANELQYSICVANCSRNINDADLLRQMATAPTKSILLFEDIDVTLPSNKRRKEIKKLKKESDDYNSFYGDVTLSGLLNALDGINSSASHLVFMTTNHITNLDDALIRPGRIDESYFLRNCDAQQAKTMFQNVYGEQNIKENEIESRFDEIKTPVSPAKFQNHLLKYKGQPEKALENMPILKQGGPQIFEEDRTIIYRCTDQYDASWTPLGDGKPMRPWNTIITQDSIKEKILHDLNDFLSSKEVYRERGITHRKGYLFYGPPGTGKTTLIAGLADKLHYNICMIELNTNEMTDSHLMTLLSTIPGRSIVVIEDIDVALPSKDRRIKRRKEDDDKGVSGFTSRVTLSGVLNALDGIFTADSQVVFMTTNYIDDLDPALVRPGRIDRKFYLGNCNKDQVKDMINEAYLHSYDYQVTELVDLIEAFDHTPSPAVLECYMLRHRLSVEDAIQNIDELKDMAKENAEKEIVKRSSPASNDDHPASLDETAGEYEKENDACENATEESTKMHILKENLEKQISQSSPTIPDDCSKTLDEADVKLGKAGEHEIFDANMENKIDNDLDNSVNHHHVNSHDSKDKPSKQEDGQNLEEIAKKEVDQLCLTPFDEHAANADILDEKLCKQEQLQNIISETQSEDSIESDK